MMEEITRERALEILLDPSRVAQVYQGIAGICCCGCSGEHTYASAHREWASERRGGSPVVDDEIDDAVVLETVGIIRSLLKSGEGYPNLHGDMISVDTELAGDPEDWALGVPTRFIAYIRV